MFRSNLLFQFHPGIIHGDCNEKNFFVSKETNSNGINNKDDKYAISAVIDFGDARHTFTIAELSIAIMSMMSSCEWTHPVDVGGYIISGYLKHMGISEAEWGMLGVFLMGRYCQRIVLTKEALELEPRNEYLVFKEDEMWRQLNLVFAIGTEGLSERWKTLVEDRGF